MEKQKTLNNQTCAGSIPILDFIRQNYNNRNNTVPTQNSHAEQQNWIEDPDTNPHRYSHLIFDKDTLEK